METNKIIGQRFKKFFKYSRLIAIISTLAFFILNAINTENGILYWVVYICLMLATTTIIQSVILYLLYKYYENKR